MKLNIYKIKLLLAEREISQTALAEQSGISRQNISTILTRGTCKYETAKKLAKALGVNVMEIALLAENNIASSRFCPLTFPAGIHLPCRSDCAWYMKSDECCAIAHIATCQNFVSGNIEEIATRIHDATP